MKTLLKSLTAVACLAAVLLWAGCSDGSEPEAPPAETQESVEETPRRAMAVITALGENEGAGRVRFDEVEGGVRISAQFNGLAAGPHGFHIHEGTVCSEAGGHFNPDGSPHGPPDAPPGQRHVGDMGNLESPANGLTRYSRVDDQLSLDGPNSIIGRAVIIHANADDLTSQPSGNAGDRIACGVIQVAN